MIYTYDFGDNWHHTIDVEKIHQPQPGATYPRCSAGRRACPPEDSGGPWGYAGMLTAIRARKGPRYREVQEQGDHRHDPEAFDLAAINAALAEASAGLSHADWVAANSASSHDSRSTITAAGRPLRSSSTGWPSATWSQVSSVISPTTGNGSTRGVLHGGNCTTFAVYGIRFTVDDERLAVLREFAATCHAPCRLKDAGMTATVW